ncbi:hypothetical protein LTR78_009518 [Recurvomyces mirabilis]|uniref:DUF7071 domain-containing protein n=2 Tax=Recurvomyces mirabilis TaxID=574656 RepID=A0AAE0TP79_9PEZI|nr:hypothetical protein LTR78_009518 [Recurvomyces mirabilis]
MQDARTAIAMIRLSKQKRELRAEKDHHRATRYEHIEALQVAQYLKRKVKSLRNVVAQITAGEQMSIMLQGYSHELEMMELKVLDRAATYEIEEAPTDIEDMPMPSSPLRKRKARKLKSVSSDGGPDILQNSNTSDSLTIDPAGIFSGDLHMTSDTSLFPSDGIEAEHIDPELLAEQLLQAREILGELADTMVAQRVLRMAPLLSREQLERVRNVLETNVEARENIFVFADDLLGE